MKDAVVTGAHIRGSNLYVEVMVDEQGLGLTLYRTIVYTRDVLGELIPRPKLLAMARQQLSATRKLQLAAREELGIEGTVLQLPE